MTARRGPAPNTHRAGNATNARRRHGGGGNNVRADGRAKWMKNGDRAVRPAYSWCLAPAPPANPQGRDFTEEAMACRDEKAFRIEGR